MNVEFSHFLIYGLPLLLAIPLHEAAHGWIADKCGDPTARMLGRVTFNPFKHIDPFGTIALPGILILSGLPFVFGWAKPVPVNFAYLNHPRRDMFLVAAAGPAVNILLAIISAIVLRLLFNDYSFSTEDAPWWGSMLFFSLLLNLALTVFNLLPLLPMDGGRMVTALLPPRIAAFYAKTERFGMLVIVALFLLPGVIGMVIGENWNLFGKYLGPVIFNIAAFLLKAVGFS